MVSFHTRKHAIEIFNNTSTIRDPQNKYFMWPLLECITQIKVDIMYKTIMILLSSVFNL